MFTFGSHYSTIVLKTAELRPISVSVAIQMI
jgi:hypothetical protein